MRTNIRCGALLLIVAVSSGTAAEENAFTRISSHYESIREVLIEDSTEDVARHAAAIREIASRLQRDFSPEAAGVTADDGAAVLDLLPEVIERAGTVASAKDLESVRRALAELTKPLVRYHAMVTGSRPVVAYCPMERKAWLQPDGPIGNPYAPYMLRCGEVVGR
jgi:hypothetical protein